MQHFRYSYLTDTEKDLYSPAIDIDLSDLDFDADIEDPSHLGLVIKVSLEDLREKANCNGFIKLRLFTEDDKWLVDTVVDEENVMYEMDWHKHPLHS